MFIGNSVEITTGTGQRYDYLQASEAAEMQKLFDKYMVDLAAENGGRETPFNIVDIDISGAGDGFTFVLRILLSTTTNATGWTDSNIDSGSVAARFWMGSDAEALSDYQEAAIASLLAPPAPSSTLGNIAVGLAGGSKGTRFMAFLGGVYDEG